MENLRFQSENLVVDYISINIKRSLNPKLLADYLSTSFGFNSTITAANQSEERVLCYHKSNNYKLSIRCHTYAPDLKSYWSGFKINFSGINSAYFYSLIRKGKIDWTLFDPDSMSLSRFDLHFLRKLNPSENGLPLGGFLDSCYQEVQLKYPNMHVSRKNNSDGLILGLGSRKSPNYYRVYLKSTGLEFEMELKKAAITKYSEFLFLGDIQRFERELSLHFYQRSLKLLCMNTPYTDWLAYRLRKVSKNKISETSLITSYLEYGNLVDFEKAQQFLTFLQFLSFINTLEGEKQYLVDQAYYKIEFPVSDFLQFTGVTKKNYYQLTKIVNFLKSLQQLDPIVNNFSDTSFKSTLCFPYLLVVKKKSRWMVTIVVSEQLFVIRYPFNFPASFLISNSKHDLQIKLELIQIISTVNITKKFYVSEFLKKFSISNKKVTNIKNLIIDAFLVLQNSKVIKPSCKLVMKKDDSIIETTELTVPLITQSELIIFYETAPILMD